MVIGQYLGPPLDSFICESCEKVCKNTMELGLHHNGCQLWQRDLTAYTKSKTKKAVEQIPMEIDNVILLGDEIERRSHGLTHCRGKKCNVKEKFQELLNLTKKLYKESYDTS